MPNDDLSEAVTLYLGYGTKAWPQRDAGRVIARFGLHRGWNLWAKARRLDGAVGRMPVDWTVDDLLSATDRARRHAAEIAPGLSDDALNALAWAFSYDWK